MRVLKNRLVQIIFLIAVVLMLLFGVNQVITLRKAHSTFENYYTFRGCVQLMKKTNDYGVCKLANGTTIKLVKYQGKWYLDGDLPFCLFNLCL